MLTVANENAKRKMARFRRKILLVDNSNTFQSLFTISFSDNDCELFVCSNGEEALSLIGSHYIDFICSSFYLPDMEGIALCRRVRHLTKNAAKPFVLLTSVDGANVMTQALPAGVTDIFHRNDVGQLLAFIKRFPSSHARIEGRVLYVEDNRSQRDALKAILEHRGLSVDSFASAEQALQHFQNHDYDLVLTDIVLDGTMSGLALVNQIRRQASAKGDTPIIAVTAFDDRTRRIELFNLGVTDYILKPVAEEELFMRISCLLENRHLKAEIEHNRLQLHEKELALAEDKIYELAFFDQLTGLPNRTLLLDRLRVTMSASSRSGRYGALMLIDMDNFKTLNDTQGYDMGDMLLSQVAQRLVPCVRDGDTVARFSGDEFIVMLTELSTNEEDAADGIEEIADKILSSLNRSYQLGDALHHSTGSIGVTLFRGHLATIDDLIKQADLAMNKAKEAGRNAWRFFDPHMESLVNERAALEIDLRLAITDKQFQLHYQPQVVDDGRLTGAEALVRWKHPQRGMVSPADFIPLAEQSGLILPLGQWVMETACTQLAVWANHPKMSHLMVAVNVSARQFQQPNFVDQVLAILYSTGANPQRLKLELTEGMLVENVKDIIEKMFSLKAKGVGFSLDDFGTGYSSLTYLKRLPLDQLKIDQSFVRDVLSDPNDAAIAKTIVALAQSLGLGVIAEGIETEAQRDFLAGVGCHAYQGYFFSRPLPCSEFELFAQRD